MITRSVAIDEQSIAEIETLGRDLLLAGDTRAWKLLTLSLAWGFAPETADPRAAEGTPGVNGQTFECGIDDIDESGGLAELYAHPGWSRKVPHAS